MPKPDVTFVPQRRARIALAVGAACAAMAASAPACASDEELETITVTAQARSQSQRDVPIALQVVTVQQIEDLGAANLADLNGYIPGLTVDGSQPTQPNFALRGIGTTDFGIGTDAPVGVYMDGIYTGKTGGSLMNFDDVRQVEVLKGPQGTLFGRNSAAGAISITSNEPEQAFDATGLLRYGRFQTVEFKGMVNTPLTDTTALRLAVASKNSSGWLTDVTTGEKFGGDGNWGTRAAFKWQPAADTKLIASWEHEALDQPARAVYSLVYVPPGNLPPQSSELPTVPPNPATFINPLTSPLENDAPNRETRTFDGLTLRYETDWSGLKFSSITGYRHFRSYNAEDNDGTSDYSTYLSTINQEVNTSVQQEFKLRQSGTLVDWVAGASYFHVDAGQVSTVDSTTDTIDTLWGNSPGLLAQTNGYPLFLALAAELQKQGLPVSSTLGLGNSWQEKMINANRTSSYALYGDTIWHLAASTNLTFGLRATRDSKDVSWYTPPYYAPGLDAQYQAATAALGGLTFGQVSGISNIVFSNAALTAYHPVSAERSWSDLSPRLVLDHKLNPNTMIYASVAKGYQSGGYDVFSPLAGFEPEHMINYEAGIKGSLTAIRASYEASVFHYKFSNLQNITLVTQSSGLPVYDVTTSDQHATGVDLSGAVELVPGWHAFGAAEYLRQNYGTYTAQDNGTAVNLDGQPVGTPLLTLELGTRYDWNMGAGKGEFLLQGTHTTPTRCNAHLVFSFECVDEGSLQIGNAETKVDLRLGWLSPGEHFGVALLVNNVFNKQYISVPDGGGESAYTLGTPYASISPPRFYGIEFSASL